MANADRPNGFRPVRYATGAMYNGAVEAMVSPTDNLFIGDLVEPTATGTAVRDGAYQEVGRAETGDPIVGVVVGFEPNPDNLSIAYHAAHATRHVYVARTRDLILEVQNNGAMAAADVGLNVDFVVAAGNTTTGASNMEVDSTTEATTNTLDLRIVGIVDSPKNEVASANARMLVMVNRDWYANQIAGV
jgi:hypothetical protein